MKDSEGKLWISLGGSVLALLCSLFAVWNNLTNQFAEVKAELRFCTQQVVAVRGLIDFHIALPSHPVAEERTRQITKELSTVEDRLVKLESRMK